MTALSLFSGNLNPSLSDFNALINTLNGIFANVSVAGDQAVSGNLTVTGTSGLTGAVSITGALTVTGASTLNGGIIGGSSANIAINTNKFTVAASSGNTLVAGTLAVTGASTLTGATTVTGNLTTSAYHLHSVGNGLTAAGSTRADALQLAKERNVVSTAAASTGVILPVGVIGMRVELFNNGANTIQVYATASETIDGTAGATGVPLTNAKRCVYEFNAANTWLSAQLGVVSA